MSRTPALDSFGRDLTGLAHRGELEPVVGRDREVERLLLAVGSRGHSAVLLLGERGVGKRALVRGLAQAVVDRGLGERLGVARVVLADAALMVNAVESGTAGTERLRACLHEARRVGAVLAIQNARLLFAGRRSESAEALRAALLLGGLKLILTLTHEEAHALDRAGLGDLFEKVYVDPPSEEAVRAALRGERDRLGRHHGVTVRDDAVDAAVTLTCQRMKGALPGKALRLLDQAAVLAKLGYAAGPPGLPELDAKIECAQKEKEKAIAESDFREAVRLRDLGDRLKKDRAAAEQAWHDGAPGRGEGHVDAGLVKQAAEMLFGPAPAFEEEIPF